jgi:hypothetical protein
LSASADGWGVKSPKPAVARKPSLVVLPPPPETPVIAVRSTKAVISKKRPTDPRQNPTVRDSKGKASRTEIRREEPRRTAPRSTGRAPERGNQPRSHKSGKK